MDCLAWVMYDDIEPVLSTKKQICIFSYESSCLQSTSWAPPCQAFSLQKLLILECDGCAQYVLQELMIFYSFADAGGSQF